MPEKKKKETKKIRLPIEEEIVLWDHVTKDVKPLTKSPQKPAKQTVKKTRDAPVPKTSRVTIPDIIPSVRLKPVIAVEKDKSSQQMSAAQRRKLERGDIEIEGRLDLHGMTQAEAHEKLLRFVKTRIKKGHRCLLIITGKGKRDETGRGMGVLRKNLPLWLENEDIRPYVLSLTPAADQHGGTGAFYLYLRRNPL